jgi:hypothetical protein
VAALVVLAACSAQPAGVLPSPTPSPTPAASASPSPAPSSDETPVESHVLAPASDPPVAKLCSTPITTTTDQNATPLFCHDGSVNVLAWAYYGAVGVSIMSLGLNPNNGQPQAAMCDDMQHNGAKPSQEVNAYRLAAAYYGWSFAFDPTKVTCQ